MASSETPLEVREPAQRLAVSPPRQKLLGTRRTVSGAGTPATPLSPCTSPKQSSRGVWVGSTVSTVSTLVATTGPPSRAVSCERHESASRQPLLGSRRTVSTCATPIPLSPGGSPGQSYRSICPSPVPFQVRYSASVSNAASRASTPQRQFEPASVTMSSPVLSKQPHRQTVTRFFSNPRAGSYAAAMHNASPRIGTALVSPLLHVQRRFATAVPRQNQRSTLPPRMKGEPQIASVTRRVSANQATRMRSSVPAFVVAVPVVTTSVPPTIISEVPAASFASSASASVMPSQKTTARSLSPEVSSRSPIAIVNAPPCRGVKQDFEGSSASTASGPASRGGLVQEESLSPKVASLKDPLLSPSEIAEGIDTTTVGTPPTAAWGTPIWMPSAPTAGAALESPTSVTAPVESASRLAARAALEAALDAFETPKAIWSPKHTNFATHCVQRQWSFHSEDPTKRSRSQEPDPDLSRAEIKVLTTNEKQVNGGRMSFKPIPRTRPTSRCTSQNVSRAASRSPTPEGQRSGQRPVAPAKLRLRAALRAARAAGLDEDLTSRAEASLQSRELEQEAKREEVRKAISEADEIRGSGDIVRLKRVKEQLEAALVPCALFAELPSDELREAERLRRLVHNAIEDLKGQLRVFCRLRPPNVKESEQGDLYALRVVDTMKLEVPRAGFFSFDSVFAPGSQEEVFEDCRDLVQSAVDGQNVTIFAYGQTGAGKTYTLYGTAEQEGIAPRAIRELFRIVDGLRKKRAVVVTASMFELYRNHLVDLLRPALRRGNSSGGSSAASSSALSPKLSLRQDRDGIMQVEQLVEREVKDEFELRRVLNRGLGVRSVSGHSMNSESSRSHLIFTIKVTTEDIATGESSTGKFILCDLGGSERVKRTEAAGDQLKEAIEINKSLSALGDVIEAVAEKRKQIPYRNHKLTQVLQDSFGGTAKTLMIVNCSPAGSNLHETTMSLNYATRAKKVTNTTAPVSPNILTRRLVSQ